MNNVQLTGYLATNVMISEKGFSEFILIVPRNSSPGGTPRTDAIPCSCGGSEAAFAQKFLKKGSNVKVSGSLRVFGEKWCISVGKLAIGT